MTPNTFELKHGEFNERLLFCNLSYRNALKRSLDSNQGENSDEAIISLNGVNFLYAYLFESYKAYCSEKNKSPKYGIVSFEEAITMENVKVEDSNLAECIEMAGNTITAEVEKLKQATEKNVTTTKEETA